MILVVMSLENIVTYNCQNIFIVQATGANPTKLFKVVIYTKIWVTSVKISTIYAVICVNYGKNSFARLAPNFSVCLTFDAA
jgi:hypothetical protein